MSLDPFGRMADSYLFFLLPYVTVNSQSQIDPMVHFRNSQGEQVRATIMNLQRKSLVMEVYNPYSIVQVSEVLSELTVRFRAQKVYAGKAVVISIVNTGLTAVVSVTLIDEWCELGGLNLTPESTGLEAQSFVREWSERFQIRRDYQIVVNEMRAFLSDASRWVDQVDLSDALPKEDNRLRADFFYELATPMIEKVKFYLTDLEAEAALVPEEQVPVHRAFAQAALHPLLLRAPFVFRTYSKPLGYAGDYQMVNQILDDPCQGSSTYFQMVNVAFLQANVATAHRNRIDILVNFLKRMAEQARRAGRPFKILNVGCGPAMEIQRFLQSYRDPELLSFKLVDFSEETLAWTRERLSSISKRLGKTVLIEYKQDSVHELLKRRVESVPGSAREFDAVYCAGLFDYFSDKVCARLTAYFAGHTRSGGTVLFTNVHSDNPERLFVMEHLLEWFLIYRNEAGMKTLIPPQASEHTMYLDDTGINVFAEAVIK